MPRVLPAEALEKFRQYLVEHRNEESVERYKFNLAADEDVQKLISGEWAMHWSGNYTFAADDPLKAKMPEGDPARTRVMSTLMPVITGANTSVAVISPYFVPGKNGTDALVKLVSDGRKVGVLTNSLVANDVAAVHGGYSRSRKPLLKGGVQIWELKPAAGTKSPVEPVWFQWRQPAHQGVHRGQQHGVRGQLQPGSALHLVELRTGSAGGGRSAGNAAALHLCAAG